MIISHVENTTNAPIHTIEVRQYENKIVTVPVKQVRKSEFVIGRWKVKHHNFLLKEHLAVLDLVDKA